MAQSGKVTTVAIQDSSKAPYYVYQKVCGTGSPYAEIAKHKHHEAAVFHSGEDYKLTYYQLEKDSIRYHAAIYGSDDIMDKAEYRWDKDTVFVRLYNSITNKEVKFGAFSHNGANSMFMVN
jgi:hypothetical protein